MDLFRVAEMGVSYWGRRSADDRLRGNVIRAIGRTRRVVLALTCLVVSAVLLMWSPAAAATEIQSPPLIPDPEDLSQIVIEAPEPRFAAPTLRDRIGRIWAPVLINGRGPYRLVLDTGATHSAIIPAGRQQSRDPFRAGSHGARDRRDRIGHGAHGRHRPDGGG